MYKIDARNITVEDFYEALHRLYRCSDYVANDVLNDFGLPNYYDFLAEYDVAWVRDYFDYKKAFMVMNQKSYAKMEVFFEDNNPIFYFFEYWEV